MIEHSAHRKRVVLAREPLHPPSILRGAIVVRPRYLGLSVETRPPAPRWVPR